MKVFNDVNFNTQQAQNIALTIFGVPLPGAKFIRVFGSNLAIGDTDLYTVPSNRRALILNPTGFNASAGSIPMYPEVKISGTYYRIASTSSTTTGASTSSVNGGGIILEAAQILAVNTTTTAGYNISFGVIEFDNTANLKSAIVTGPATGDNTIYTVPAGKTAHVLGQGGVPAFGTANSGIFIGLVHFVADGSTRNIILYSVPSGGSSGSTNKMGASLSVGASSRTASGFFQATLAAGDFIVLNVDTGNAAQIAWVNVLEI